MKNTHDYKSICSVAINQELRRRDAAVKGRTGKKSCSRISVQIKLKKYVKERQVLQVWPAPRFICGSPPQYRCWPLRIDFRLFLTISNGQNLVLLPSYVQRIDSLGPRSYKRWQPARLCAAPPPLRGHTESKHDHAWEERVLLAFPHRDDGWHRCESVSTACASG